MSVIPAALVAAGFVFGASPVQAKHIHHRQVKSSAAPKTSAQSHSHPKASVHKTKSPASAKSSLHRKTSPRAVSAVSPEAGQRTDKVDQVDVEFPELYGPSLPLQVYDFPRPQCSEHDAVAEAHLHEDGEEASEPDFDEIVVPPPPGPITRVARQIGALLRPKSAQSKLRPEDVDLSDLLTAGVQIPVEGVDASGLKDSFLSSRGAHSQHLAIDIGAPKGTPVLAAADGEISALRREKRGGISLYQKDATGRYLLFYCHLTRYEKGLRPGQKVARGDVIAYVGRTGHVIGGPHLHFSITRLPEDDNNFKAGVAINPYLLFLAAVP